MKCLNLLSTSEVFALLYLREAPFMWEVEDRFYDCRIIKPLARQWPRATLVLGAMDKDEANPSTNCSPILRGAVTQVNRNTTLNNPTSALYPSEASLLPLLLLQRSSSEEDDDSSSDGGGDHDHHHRPAAEVALFVKLAAFISYPANPLALIEPRAVVRPLLACLKSVSRIMRSFYPCHNGSSDDGDDESSCPLTDEGDDASPLGDEQKLWILKHKTSIAELDTRRVPFPALASNYPLQYWPCSLFQEEGEGHEGNRPSFSNFWWSCGLGPPGVISWFSPVVEVLEAMTTFSYAIYFDQQRRASFPESVLANAGGMFGHRFPAFFVYAALTEEYAAFRSYLDFIGEAELMSINQSNGIPHARACMHRALHSNPKGLGVQLFRSLINNFGYICPRAAGHQFLPQISSSKLESPSEFTELSFWYSDLSDLLIPNERVPLHDTTGKFNSSSTTTVASSSSLSNSPSNYNNYGSSGGGAAAHLPADFALQLSREEVGSGAKAIDQIQMRVRAIELDPKIHEHWLYLLHLFHAKQTVRILGKEYNYLDLALTSVGKGTSPIGVVHVVLAMDQLGKVEVVPPWEAESGKTVSRTQFIQRMLSLETLQEDKPSVLQIDAVHWDCVGYFLMIKELELLTEKKEDQHHRHHHQYPEQQGGPHTAHHLVLNTIRIRDRVYDCYQCFLNVMMLRYKRTSLLPREAQQQVTSGLAAVAWIRFAYIINCMIVENEELSTITGSSRSEMAEQEEEEKEDPASSFRGCCQIQIPKLWILNDRITGEEVPGKNDVEDLVPFLLEQYQKTIGEEAEVGALRNTHATTDQRRLPSSSLQGELDIIERADWPFTEHECLKMAFHDKMAEPLSQVQNEGETLKYLLKRNMDWRFLSEREELQVQRWKRKLLDS